MRGLWRAIALMGEDANSFDDQLAPIASQVKNQNLIDGAVLSAPSVSPKLCLNLVLQPTPAILQAIDAFLRAKDATLILCAYELAEVNRITCETNIKESPRHKSLKAYWQGLGAVGPQNRNTPGFMEAVGGLAADGWTRSQFAAGNFDLTKMFALSAVSAGDLKTLQSKMAANSQSDLAAQTYTDLMWHPTCGSVISMASTWVHFNA